MYVTFLVYFSYLHKLKFGRQEIVSDLLVESDMGKSSKRNTQPSSAHNSPGFISSCETVGTQPCQSSGLWGQV